MGRKVASAACKIPLFWNISFLRCSFEDIEAMISTLLVLSALIISVVVAIMVGIQRDDLKEGDMLWINYMNMTSKPWVLTIDAEGIWHTAVDPFSWDWSYGGFVSHVIADRSIKSVGYLIAAIFILTATYLSLHVSNAREDPCCLRRWLFFGCWLIGGSFALFLIAFFQSTMVIGNAMGILFPAIRRHASYSDLVQEVGSADHSNKNFIIEPKVQGELQYYTITGLVVGLVGGFLALCASMQFISSETDDEKEKNEEMFNHLKNADLGGDENVEECCNILLREHINLKQLGKLSAEQLAWMGIPYGDALRIVEKGSDISSSTKSQAYDTDSPVTVQRISTTDRGEC
jgi:hypothetical protein